MSKALNLLKGLISSVDQEVLELDRARRLQEIQARLDPRAQAEVRGAGVFKGGELLRRKLRHEGSLLWKVQGSRTKGRCHLFACCDVTPRRVGGAYSCMWAGLTAADPPLCVCLQMFRSC